MTGSQSATIAIMQKALQASPESREEDFVGAGMIQEVDPIVMA